MMGPQSRRSPNIGNNLRVPKQNAISMWGLWRGIEYTIRGKVVASPSLGCGEFYESEFACASS
jgi:hypothetical protein